MLKAWLSDRTGAEPGQSQGESAAVVVEETRELVFVVKSAFAHITTSLSVLLAKLPMGINYSRKFQRILAGFQALEV